MDIAFHFAMTSAPKPSTLLALSLLLAIATCVGAQPPQASEENPHSAIAQKIKQKGLPNLGLVTPALYRGAVPTPEGIEALQKMGVGIVVDMRPGPHQSEEQTVTQRGMRYVSLPSLCYSPKDEVFARFLAVVRDNSDKKIFVHCQLGVDRTGMAVASYRMAEQGWSADEAMKEMQAFGFSSAHHLMCPGLAAYEKAFPARLKNNPAFQPPPPSQ
jgi:Dual specificity phosphatase, catalytic domain